MLENRNPATRSSRKCSQLEREELGFLKVVFMTINGKVLTFKVRQGGAARAAADQGTIQGAMVA